MSDDMPLPEGYCKRCGGDSRGSPVPWMCRACLHETRMCELGREVPDGVTCGSCYGRKGCRQWAEVHKNDPPPPPAVAPCPGCGVIGTYGATCRTCLLSSPEGSVIPHFGDSVSAAGAAGTVGGQ